MESIVIPDRTGSYTLLGTEDLRPVRVNVANANVLIAGAHDVPAVPFAIHPGVHDCLGRALPSGDVFADRPAAKLGLVRSLSRALAVGIVVREIAAVHHVLRVLAGSTNKAAVVLKWSGGRKTLTATRGPFGTSLVHKRKDIFFKADIG